MARAFLSGLVIGSAVSATVGASLSIMVGLPERLQAISAPRPVVEQMPGVPTITPEPLEPDVSGPDVAEPVEPQRTMPSETGDPAPQDEVIAEPALPVTPETKSDLAEVAQPDALAQDPAAPQEAQDTIPATDGPDDLTGPDAGDAVVTPDGPAEVPNAQLATGTPPSVEADPALFDAPAPEAGAPEADRPDTLDLAGAETAPQEPEASAAPPIPEVAEAPDVAVVAPDEEPAPDVPNVEPRRIARDVEPVPLPDEAVPESMPGVSGPDSAAPAVVAVRPAPQTTEAEAGPSIGRPATSLTEREGAVPTGRLVRIGEASEPEPIDDTLPTAVPDDAPPVERFAMPIEVDPALPRLSVVLIHDADAPVGPDAIAGFPLPLTIAIDALLPNAADLAQAYRAQGHEVLAMIGVPDTARPVDVEVAVAGALQAVPEALGIIEGIELGLQSDRALSDQATAIALDGGLGLIFQPKGLNTAEALAAKDGVPTASVFRDFDGKGQDARVIRRFLDQAAFRARQSETGSVLLGRMRPDTLSALVVWGLQDRASTVALVPVSMVLATEAD